MSILNAIKNSMLVGMIAIATPVLVYLYVEYFYPYPIYNQTQEIKELNKKLWELSDKERLSMISFEQGRIKQAEIEKLKKEIKDFETERSEKETVVLENYKEERAQHSNNVFIIIMALALILVLLGVFLPNNLLKTSLTAGGLFLILYGFLFTWSDIATFKKLVTMSIWFLLLFFLIIYYYGNEEKH